MIYRLLADLVFTIHFLFIIVVTAGGLVVYWTKWFMFLHLPFFTWGVLIMFLGLRCPLTPLEQWLLVQAGENAYSGGFIDNYLVNWIYPAGLTRTHQIILGTALLIFNLLVYSFIIYVYSPSDLFTDK